MALEIPWDLINQVQISLRKEAKLPSYDPNDSSLPSLPSASCSIADLDPSPSYLRCRHCKGRLLRGEKSVLCIFCGKQQSKDASPEPINYRSTAGYRWFLQSVDLDGSEVVGPSIDAKESNRGPKAGSDEVPLSDLLDLQIRCHAEPEKLEASISDGKLIPSSLNLAGVNFDDFFPEGKGDTVLAPTRDFHATGSSAFQDSRNLSLFENVQPSETAVRSTEKIGNSFSGWEADFQSAGSKSQHEGSKSVDPFGGSSKDSSTQMNRFSASRKDLAETEKDNRTSFTSNKDNIFQDSMQYESTAERTSQEEQFDVTVNAEDVRKTESGNSSSMNVSWIQGDQWPISSSKTPNSKPKGEDDDSFDNWNDFASSTGAANASDTSLGKTANHTASIDDKSGESFPGSESSVQFKSHHKDSEVFDPFVGSPLDLSVHMDSVFGSGKAKDDTTSSAPNSNNWFQDDMWSNSTSGVTCQDGQVAVNIKVKDGGTVEDPNNSSKIEDDQWQTNSNSAPNNNTTDEDEDSFGDWNDFKGSTTAKDASTSSLKETANHSGTEEKVGSSFSGWDVDFQSAKSNAHHEGSKTLDPFMSSSVDLSPHIDSLFGSGKGLFDGKENDSTTSTSNTNNWLQDDLWSKSTSGVTHQVDHFDGTPDVKDIGTLGHAQDSPSVSVDWFSGNQSHTSSGKAADKITIDEDEDSIDTWNDFKSSTTAQDASSSSWKQTADHMTPTELSSKTEQFDDKPRVKDEQTMENANSSSSMSVDWTEGNEWHSSSTKAADNKTNDENYDTSDVWNDFTSSVGAQDPSNISFTQTVKDTKASFDTSEANLFSISYNSRSNDFGSFSQPEFFSGAFSNQDGSSITQAVSMSDRMADSQARDHGSAELVSKDGDISIVTTSSKTDDIEMLMSQMHDLSFMLESNLSIPQTKRI